MSGGVGQKCPGGQDKNVHHNNKENNKENRERESAHAPGENPLSFVEKNTPAPQAPPPPPSPKTDGAISYDSYPNARSSQELKERLRNYFTANPNEWQDGVLEQSGATKWGPEKIQETITKFCAQQEAEGNLKRTYGQYKGMLVKWFIDQKRFDVKPGNSRQPQEAQSALPKSLQKLIG